MDLVVFDFLNSSKIGCRMRATIKKRMAVIVWLFSWCSMWANQWITENNDACHMECDSFDVRFQAGIEPLMWRNRGGIFGENAIINGIAADRLFSFGDGLSADPTEIVQGQCIPRFSTFFKLPWVVGGQVGYRWRDCWRFFLEGNYAQAKAKKPCKTRLLVLSSTGAPAGTTLNFTLNNYRFVDGYVGLQCFFATLCNVDVFVGAKIGLIHHLRSNFSLTQTLPLEEILILDLVPPCPKVAFIESGTAFAGGALFGANYAFCDNWLFAIMAEVVANRGPKTNCNIPVNIPNIPTVSLFFGKIKNEIRFPITASLRYIF